MQPLRIEFAERKVVAAFQANRLAAFLQYLSAHSPFYKALFKESGINSSAIKKLPEITRLPFTAKDDLAARNDEFLCVSRSKIADYVTTSGTLGEPVAFYLTRNDLKRLAYNEALSMRCAGAGKKDVFQLMTTMDRSFMAGLAYWLGAQKSGAGIIRIGPGNPYLQWDAIRRFNPTILIAIPSFIPVLLDFAEQNKIDYKKSSVRKIICIGEPIRNTQLELNALGKRILSKWSVELFSTYASTEMGAAFTECAAGKGGHHQPELLITEVLDENDRQVASGESGEVVVTTLGVEGMPLLRYRTGDICSLHEEKCACGRTSIRLGPVQGRRQQMLKFKGTTLFPPAIFDALDHLEAVKEYVVSVKSDAYGNDAVEILLSESVRSDELENMLKSLMRSRLRVNIPLEYLPDEQLQRIKFNPDKRKPVKFLDSRKK